MDDIPFPLVTYEYEYREDDFITTSLKDKEVQVVLFYLLIIFIDFVKTHGPVGVPPARWNLGIAKRFCSTP